MKFSSLAPAAFHPPILQVQLPHLYILWAHEYPVHISFSPERHRLALKLLPEASSSGVAHHEELMSIDTELMEKLLGKNPMTEDAQHFSPFLKKATQFQRKVWELLAEIPAGETRTYGELARMSGNPERARAVGQACNANPLPLIIPCHRLIGATGIGGYAGGLAMKKHLLEFEQKKKIKQ